MTDGQEIIFLVVTWPVAIVKSNAIIESCRVVFWKVSLLAINLSLHNPLNTLLHELNNPSSVKEVSSPWMHFPSFKSCKISVLPGTEVVSFRSSGGTGQSGPQLPHLPWPPTWWPVSSTKVEHHALCSVKWAWSQVHWVWTTPLNRNGKMHGNLGDAPLSVVHTILAGFFLLLTSSASSVKTINHNCNKH